VPNEDPRVRRAESFRRLDVLVLEHFQRGAAHDAGEPRRVDEDERGGGLPEPRPEDGDQREREQQRRERQQHVHRPHDDVVGEVAVVRRDRSQRDAGDRRDADRDGAELHRNPGAVQRPLEDVAGGRVGAEKVRVRRRGADPARRCAVRNRAAESRVGQHTDVEEDARVQRHEHHRGDDDDAGERDAVREQFREELRGA